MTGHYNLNESQTELSFVIDVKIPIIKNDGPLTAAQYEALKNYCQRYISGKVSMHQIDAPIYITPCEIYRKTKGADADTHRNNMFYDAETGDLYNEADISEQIKDGQHEIRLSPSESRENGENQAKAC